MADTLTTLAELILFNSQNVNPAEITNILNGAPALSMLHAMPSSNGTLHKYNIETGAPVVGFRAVNDGADYTAGSSTQTSVTLKYIDAKVIEDAAECNAFKDGAEAWLDRRTARQLRQAMFVFEQQVWYGTVHGDAAGFAGLANDANYNQAADALVVNAAGTTAGTGSSVWLLASTPDDAAFALVGAGDPLINGGNNINFTVSDTFKTVVPGANNKSMTALCRDAGAHLGIQVGSKYACVRIANLTADSGKGLTDGLLEDAMALFPSNMQPTLIAMSRRSRKQLRKSRTTYSPTGTPAPNPIDFDGVPLVATDSIIDTETLLV
jgi:hypothetical protein